MPHLLLVDDQPAELQSLEKYLQSPELEISTCASARDAFQIAVEREPDVVIMDVSLPDMTGLTAYRLIHKKLPALPVIIMAAIAKTESAIEAMKNGAFDYFVKPVEIERMKAVVARALEMKRLNGLASQLEVAREAGNGAAASTNGNSPVMHEVHAASGQVAGLSAGENSQGDDFPGLATRARELLHHSPGTVYRRLTAAVDTIAIQEALRYAKGNQLHAAALLGISRTTLRSKLRTLGLSVEKQVSNNGTAS